MIRLLTITTLIFLWKLDRKIQARYFWSMVLKMEDAEEDLLNQIKDKLITGPQNS